MTPQQTQVWTRYHKASEMLADATDNLILAQQAKAPPWKPCARITLSPRLARVLQLKPLGISNSALWLPLWKS